MNLFLEGRSDTRVTVNAAPTAESVRLYHDMVDRAREEVLGMVPVASNHFGFTVVKLQRDLLTRLIVAFELNGKRMQCEIPIRPQLLSASSSVRDVHQHLVDELAKCFADEFLRSISRDYLSELSPLVKK